MKNQKSKISVLLLTLGAAVFLLNPQPGVSHAQTEDDDSHRKGESCRKHHKEVKDTIVVGGASKFFKLPALDRAVSLTLTFIADGGEEDFSFGEQTVLYRTTSGVMSYPSGPITPENLPDGLFIAYGLVLIPGTNGSFAIQTYGFSTTGSLTVSMSY